MLGLTRQVSLHQQSPDIFGAVGALENVLHCIVKAEQLQVPLAETLHETALILQYKKCNKPL